MSALVRQSGSLLFQQSGQYTTYAKGSYAVGVDENIAKGVKSSFSEDSYWNKPVNSLVANYSFNHIEYEWVMPDTDPCRNR